MANKIYKVDETAVDWRPSGGDLAITLTSLASGAGRQGAQKDFGAGATARARRYSWRFWTQFATTPVLYEVVGVFWKSGDADALDNDDGTGDIAVSAQDKLLNLVHIGTLVVDEAAADIEMSTGGVIETDERYGMPVIWNYTADALTATAAEHGFTLTPIPPEIQ